MTNPFFKKTLLVTGLFFASTLYATPLSLTPIQASELSWQTITTPKSITKMVTKKLGADTPVATYRIPADGPMKINIRSYIQDNKDIFMPSALVLDSNFQIAARYPANTFKVINARGIEDTHLENTLNLTPTGNQKYIYLVIYTTENSLKGTTEIIHPAKLFAKAVGNEPPAISDITLTHTQTGKLEIQVEKTNSTQFIGLGSGTPTSQNTVIGKNVVHAPEKVESDTEKYFNQAVLKALKNNDVNKAMNLVNEAESLGLKSPRKTFIDYISKKN